MIVLTFKGDSRGRPLIELLVAASLPRITALGASGESPPSPVPVRALVDTGASHTMIQRSVLDRLGLEPVGEELVHTASTGGTPKHVGAYTVQLDFAGVPGGRLASDLRVMETESLAGLGVELLLGRDVLEHLLLILDGPEDQFTIAFSPVAAPT